MKKTILILALGLLPAAAFAVTAEEYYDAGQRLFKAQDYEKAVQYFHAAIEQRPDYWQAYQFIGEAYYQAANRTEAVVAMEQSLKMHPNNPELKKFLAKVKGGSPWVAEGGFASYLPWAALLLAVLALVWNGLLTYRLNARGITLWTRSSRSAGEPSGSDRSGLK